MPTYEYECPKCGVFETEQRITEAALTICPDCEKNGKPQPVKRLISAPAFHLKGGGWYKDLYSSPNPNAKNGDSSSAASSASAGEAPKSDAKSSDSKTAPCSSSCGCASTATKSINPAKTESKTKSASKKAT